MANEPKSAKAVSLRQRRKLLHKFRDQYGITLVELGKLANVSQPMLSQFERGRRDLSTKSWAQVLLAMTKLLKEDEDRRKQQRSEAAKTAAKLGVTDPVQEVIRGTHEMAMDLSFGLQKKNLLAELYREALDLLQQVFQDLDQTLKVMLLKKPDLARKLLGYTAELKRSIDAHNQRFADLAAQGYVMLPQSLEQERDQLRLRVSELEKEVRALKDDQEEQREGEEQH
jgi:transcriptional regulator with XRE-family HTH domain